MNEINKSAAFWRSFPIFEGFSKDTIGEITTIVTFRKWSAGTVIFQRGDEGNYLIVLISGRIKLSLITPQGRELSLRHLEAGSILGEMAILDGQPRSADATAVTATEGYVISKRDFLEVLARNPPAAQAIITYLCGKLRETTEQLETIALYDLDSRVARFFLATLRQIHGDELPESANLQLPLSQTEIAGIVGASRPKINRAILALEQAGAIRRTEGIITCHIGRLFGIAEPDDE
ncbi:Crp/Fnr family transcriptional regulator [Sinorhizobium sp. BG8]|uniref:Crp/Fnr family transcriptional regulator n=1 Tax=Sinorhizobium sp. BG8 TaxID=2613773 RepID=UPI00193DD1A1|nr:Crp/Fnr family transcriptional regulator [Sinorhizobium sp. BG8]QRM54077.1 Crp/Fnr family transcriptional regulator [Sinorhizobium sp. BG8]